MNIIDLQERLRDFPEQALMQEMQAPSGMAPQFLVLSELKRRKRMRDDYQRAQAADMKTVAEEAITGAGVPQGGIMQMAGAMAPNTNVAQDTGIDDAMQRVPTQAPQPTQDQGIASIRGMAAGGYVKKMQQGTLVGAPQSVVIDGRQYLVAPDGSVTTPLGEPVSFAEAERAKIAASGQPVLGGGLGDVSTDIADFDATEAAMAAPPIQFMTDPSIREMASRQGVSVEEFWNSLSDEAKERQLRTYADTQGIAEDGTLSRISDLPVAAQPQIFSPPVMFGGFSIPPEPVPQRPVLGIQGYAREPSAYTPRGMGIDALSNIQNMAPNTANQYFPDGLYGMDTSEDAIARDRVPMLADLTGDAARIAAAQAMFPQPDFDSPEQIAANEAVREEQAANRAAAMAAERAAVARQNANTAAAAGQSELAARLSAEADDLEAQAANAAESAAPEPVPEAARAAEAEASRAAEAARMLGINEIPERPRMVTDAGKLIGEPSAAPETKPPAPPEAQPPVGGGFGPIESRIAQMLEEREKSAAADKWLALAQTGLALMASRQPTLGGAIGEAGLAGIGAMRQAKSQYDKDVLGLLNMQADIQRAKASGARATAPKVRTPAELKGALEVFEAEVKRLAKPIYGPDPSDPLGMKQVIIDYDYESVPRDVMNDYIRLRNQYLQMFQTPVDVTS